LFELVGKMICCHGVISGHTLIMATWDVLG
jgi:hypothetical protein